MWTIKRDCVQNNAERSFSLREIPQEKTEGIFTPDNPVELV